MTNNDILRRIRYAFDFDDSKMMALFGQADLKVSREQISAWLKKDDDPAFVECSESELALFLDGLINDRRGKKEGLQPKPDLRLNNNIIFRKLRIALNLKDEGVLELLALAGFPITKPELSALFRKPDNRHFRVCKDQILRNFIKGVQLKYRPDKTPKKTAEKAAEKPAIENFSWSK
ncbi:DUF1456 family protein [Mariprofundus sp. NF]|uniref:DUF1456 family protein n=1 Tax=Mariprofundus sp. NF TaxID=2608716 RepID=UPI0015A44390|nr:DUF1456 family protein [Mariprofundus sp. NF]NWF39615.1 DUF1456 family protein [Mariprofundus sp. NF]